MTDLPPDTAKRALRAQLRKRRRDFIAAGPSRTIALPDFVKARITRTTVVASYLPQAAEADPLPMTSALLALGARIALPHVVTMGVPMRFLRWAPGDPLATNRLGIDQPLDSASEVTPDIILTPLVGFDSDCNRLGQGGGFYDRAFDEHPRALRIGVAWSVQQVESIPTDQWDKRLHAVITECGVLMGEEI